MAKPTLFLKKGQLVEAIRLPGSLGRVTRVWGESISGGLSLAIPTLEGQMIAEENDWIIKGVKGEFYPCKPDIFDATYELVRDFDG